MVDREYAPSMPLPGWLKEFANRELNKASPFSDIKNIFRDNKETVEAKVEELRERVGLDLIEKVATIRQVERAKERGSGTTKKWCVYPKNGGKSLGCHETKEGAEKQLQAIEINKADDFYIQEVEDEIFGGLGDNLPDKRYDKEQLEKGIKVELEHTNNPMRAKEITKDHLEESKDFKGGYGGKYYDKLEDMEDEIEDELVEKAARLQYFVMLANELESEGNIKAAMLVDNRIKKLADEIHFEKLTKMPIMPVEMWSDLMLAQVVKQPELAVSPEDKVKWEKAKSLFETKVKEKSGLSIRDLGEWGVERGWFILCWAGIPMGFFDGGSQANLSKELLIKQFAETGKFPNGLDYLKGDLYDNIYQDSWHKFVESRYESDKIEPEEVSCLGYADHEVKNILHPGHNQKARKEYAEKAIGVYKAPEGFKPVPDAQVKGSLPTKKNTNSVWKNIDVAGEEYLEKLLREQHKKELEAQNDFISDAVERVNKKLQYEYDTGKKLNPQEMADDIRLSCRSFRLSKRAISMEEWKKMIGPEYEELKKRFSPTIDEVKIKPQFPTYEEWLERQKKGPEVMVPEVKEKEEVKNPQNEYYLLEVMGKPLGIYTQKNHAEVLRQKFLHNFEIASPENNIIADEVVSKFYEPDKFVESFLENEDYWKERTEIGPFLIDVISFKTDAPIRDLVNRTRERTSWIFSGEDIREFMSSETIQLIKSKAHISGYITKNIYDLGNGKIDRKDIVNLEKYEQSADDTKDVFDKYPGIKKHIKNICETREGHIDAPALLQIIKNRPESLTDGELDQIKDYIREQIKENKSQMSSNDDDVIGRGGVEADMEDDDNKEVFNTPSKV